MPIVSMMRIAGDPDDLAAKTREHLQPVAERLAPKHGGLASITVRDGDDGILIINVWEHEEGRHAIAEEPEIRQALQAAGFPGPKFEAYEVLDMRVTDQAVR